MFDFGASNRQRDRFAAQFTADGAGFVYRRYTSGEAYRVTTAQRDAFIAEYGRKQKRDYWIMVAAVTAILIVFVTIDVAFDLKPQSAVMRIPFLAAIIGVGLLYVVTSSRAFTAPARVLEFHAPIAGELSRDERKTLLLRRLTWGQLAWTVCIALFAALRGYPYDGWNKLWLVFSVPLIAMTIVQAIRKWRLDHGD